MAVPTSPSLFNQGDSQSVITDFRIKHHYQRDGHVYQLGITSPSGFKGQSAAFVQLAAPTLLWVVDWTGCRFYQKAMIPDPDAIESGWVLLEAWLEPFMVVIAANGTTPLYRCSGVYIYGHKNPGPKIYNNTAYPVAPWVNDTSIIRTIDANDLQKYLLEPRTKKLDGGTAPGDGPGLPLGGGVAYA